MAVWTKEMMRFHVLVHRNIFGEQAIPSQRTYSVMRIIGVIFLIIGLLLIRSALN